MFTAENPDVYRFCTDSLPSRDRLSILREEFGRLVVGLEFEPLGDDPYRCETALLPLPDPVMGTVAASGTSITRTPELISSDTKDDIVLCLGINGRMSASGRGRDIELSTGDAMILPYTETCKVRFPGSGASYTGLPIPRNIIESRVPAVMDLVVRPVPRNNEALQLLVRYLHAQMNKPFPSSPAVQRALVTHVHDLAAIAISAIRGSTALAETRGVRAARLESIKTYITANLHRGELSATTVASYHYITPRYLHKLFEGQETSFSRFVLDQRLDRAMELLKDPRYAGQTVTAIAHMAGFNDLSYFNRCFRRRYLTTPSSVR